MLNNIPAFISSKYQRTRELPQQARHNNTNTSYRTKDVHFFSVFYVHLL